MRSNRLSFSKKLFFSLAVLLVPFCSIAATISINNQVFEYRDLTIDQFGNIVVNIDTPINGEPKPSPPPPAPKPEPQPPVSGNCPKPPKDLIQEKMPIQRFTKNFEGHQSFALRFVPKRGTGLFWFDAVNRKRMTRKLVTISECPGDFNTNQLSPACYTVDVTGTLYYTVSNNNRNIMCQMKAGKTYYVNVKDADSDGGQSAVQGTLY